MNDMSLKAKIRNLANEKGIAGVDARELLAEMKRIVDEAGEKESKGNKSDD